MEGGREGETDGADAEQGGRSRLFIYLFIYLLSDLQSRSLNTKCPIVTLKKPKKTQHPHSMYLAGEPLNLKINSPKENTCLRENSSATVVEPGYIYQKGENQGNVS